MVKVRNDASQVSFEMVLAEMRGDEEAPKKRQKPRKARMSDAALAGEVVVCKLNFNDHEIETKMLFGCRGADLYMHADPPALGFVQYAMHHEFIAEHNRPEVEPKARRASKKELAAKDGEDDGKDKDKDKDGDGDEVAGVITDAYGGSTNPSACGSKDTPTE